MVLTRLTLINGRVIERGVGVVCRRGKDQIGPTGPSTSFKVSGSTGLRAQRELVPGRRGDLIAAEHSEELAPNRQFNVFVRLYLFLYCEKK
jgi:hypothetical protein